MNELALFAGAGGGILGGKLLGWRTVGACEIEEYPREVLLARQRDGLLPKFPIWDDVCTFDGRPWRGLVDVVSGGFPCQDISSAGKGAGIEGARSGLWKEMYRIICEIRPRFAFMENSPRLTSRGLGTVLGDLAEAGYDAAWMVLGAYHVGAPHQRDRIWILAEDRREGTLLPHADTDCVPSSQLYESHEGAEEFVAGGAAGMESGGRLACESGAIPDTVCSRVGGQQCCEKMEEITADTVSAQCEGVDGMPQQYQQTNTRVGNAGSMGKFGRGWEVEPNVGRVANGVASRVDRLTALGNGQVPLVAATAFTLLRAELERSIYGH